MSNINELKLHWEKGNLRKGDCRLTSFTRILNINGNNIRQADVIGFSAGLDFDFEKILEHKSSTFWGICGRKLDCEEEFSKIFNIDFYSGILGNCTERIDLELKILINKGVPVVINLDRFYLDYLPFDKAHYGLHNAILVGINEGKDYVELLDVMNEGVSTLSLKNFHAANNSDIKYSPPKGYYYWINDKLDRIETNRHLYENAIENQISIAFGPKGYLSRLTTFINYLDEIYEKSLIHKKYTKYYNYQLELISGNIAGQEGSGSFYRSLYFDFLDDYFDNYLTEKYTDFSVLKIKNLMSWSDLKEISNLIRKRESNCKNEIIEKLKEIRTNEYELFEFLSEAIGGINESSI